MCGLHRLTIENGRRGLRVAPGRQAYAFAQAAVDLFPKADLTPLPKVIVDRFPLRQIMRQQTPGNTPAQHVEHGIDDSPHLLSAWSAARRSDAGLESARPAHPVCALRRPETSVGQSPGPGAREALSEGDLARGQSREAGCPLLGHARPDGP